MGEKLRLDKWLANMGMGSRKDVRAMIRRGEVQLNGKVHKVFSTTVDTDKDQVVCRGQQVIYEKYIYLMMNKPAGYVSANEDKRDPVVMELLQEPYSYMELFVAGRLDKDTEGLLVLTNNGKFAHNMLAPKKHVPKTYYVEIEGRATEEDGKRLAEGITIDQGYTCMPAQLEILESGETSRVHLTICEGKFHQVKRMFAALGKPVTYLRRVKMGGLSLDETLPLGEVRPLTREEVLAIGADLGEN